MLLSFVLSRGFFQHFFAASAFPSIFSSVYDRNPKSLRSRPVLLFAGPQKQMEPWNEHCRGLVRELDVAAGLQL